MLRDFDLGFTEQLLEVAHAQGALAKQIEHPEPGPVAEALINFD